MEDIGTLNSGLSMEFRGVRDLEEDVLHDVRAVRPLELERLALEEHVVESPSLCGEDRWEALLTLLDEEGEINGA